jgi:hypothetical protein
MKNNQVNEQRWVESMRESARINMESVNRANREFLGTQQRIDREYRLRMGMKPKFSTEMYVRSHAKEPKGRGCWAFSFDGGKTIGFSRGCTSYAEAKQGALYAAELAGVAIVHVLP